VTKAVAAYRSRIITAAEGRVLEIGIGSGLNLPYYSPNVAHVIGLEPSPKLLAMARRVERTASRPVEFIEGSAEAIPLKDASVDTVVTTWTLCSIPDAPRALRDMRRVLLAVSGGGAVWHTRVAAAMIKISSIRPANITTFNMASLHHWRSVLPRLRLRRCELRHSLARPIEGRMGTTAEACLRLD
jgi:ubiquinone/menaquinone biosynthesis C-methylase UbiE